MVKIVWYSEISYSAHEWWKLDEFSSKKNKGVQYNKDYLKCFTNNENLYVLERVRTLF